MTAGTVQVVSLSVVVSACFAAGQLLMKKAVGHAAGDPGLVTIIATCLQQWEFWAGGCATAAGAALWLKVLSIADLSTAYPLIGLTFVFVMVGGVWLLGERVTTAGIVGAALVIAGVTTIAWRG